MNRLRQSLRRALWLMLLCPALAIWQTPAVSQEKDQAEKKPAKAKTEKKSSEDTPQKPPEKLTAIINAKVLTMGSAGTIEDATIVIEGQKIKSVSREKGIPAKALTIDAKGMTVAPGLIDSRSNLWLASDSLSASASDGSLNAVDAVDPFSDLWQEVARQGITTVNVGPKGSLGGQSVILRVAPATATAQLLIKDGAAMQASIGLSGSTGNSRDRYLQYESLKKKFDSAKAYKESWKKYEEALKKYNEAQKKASAEKKKPEAKKTDAEKPATKKPEADKMAAAEDKQAEKKTESESAKKTEEKKTEEKKSEPPKKPTKDPAKEALVKVLDKKLPLRIEAHRPDDVAHALKLAKDFDLTITLEGVSNAGRTWETLKKEHPALIAGPITSFESTPSYASSKEDRYQHLSDYEGLLAISTFARDPRASRLLRFHAAEAVTLGVSADTALAAITTNAAKVLGIDDQVGSLEAGKLADLVIFAGDPLNPASPVMLTMSHGEIVFQDEDVTPAATIKTADAHSIPDTLPKAYAIVSDRVLLPNGKLSPAAVLVRDGKVAAVRKDKSKTGDVRVIDVGAAVVTPGMIVGHYADSVTRTSDAVAGRLRATDAISPESNRLEELSEDGFTTVVYAPDSRSVVAGQVGAVRILADNEIVADGKGKSDWASKFVLSSSSRSSNRFPASLAGQMQLVQDYFKDSPPRQNLYLPAAAMKHLQTQQDKLKEELKAGKMVAVLEASTAPEIEAAAKVAKQFGLKPLILNPTDVGSSVEELKAMKAGLIVRTMSASDYHWYAADLAKASNAGLKLSIAGSGGTRIRQTLATLVNAGMKPEAALRALTSDAAAGYGLKTVGRLAKGSVADIVIWDDSPLNMTAKPLSVIVDGRLTEVGE